MTNTRGFTITLAFGSYGGFYATFTEWTWRICLGWMAFTVYPRTDLEAFILTLKGNQE